MCHQSVGLIAREIEARGIPTTSLSSALSITSAVQPPRVAYLDYPLGHTAGKPLDPDDQLSVVRGALRLLTDAREPARIEHLPNEWQSDHSWKDRVMRPRSPEDQESSSRNTSTHADDRVERFDTPQYQTPEDAARADAHCPSCVFLEDSK